jgi:two-component system, LytTR family, sensor histidine kinase AlgZ
MTSIDQNAHTGALPDFRNLGITLRILVIVDGMCLAAALLNTTKPFELMEQLVDLSAIVQPILMSSVLMLAAVNNWLHRMRYRYAIAALIGLELAVTTAMYFLGQTVFKSMGGIERYWILTAMATGVLIGYFDLRGRALSPALTEARLQALQSRIRPHFLFNSINAVLSLIRVDPKHAERVLEDLADLFRVLMADTRQLTQLGQEIDLARQYLSIEQLRLGDRLQIEWDIADMPHDALIPPLVLQPLLENAVYHGIEPRTEAGIIAIRIHRVGDQVEINLRNPYRQEDDRHSGNRMAFANIRERLALHFDAEASIKTAATDDSYQVTIVIPYRKEQM